jgi:hypothetical protein
VFKIQDLGALPKRLHDTARLDRERAIAPGDLVGIVQFLVVLRNGTTIMFDS